MSRRALAAICAVFMAAAASASIWLSPTQKLSAALSRTDLKVAIPQRFGDWAVEKSGDSLVVNPQAEEVLKNIYTQIVARTYVNSSGYRVMLSVAYGDDQRDAKQLHYPEVCYPAQGFVVQSNEIGRVITDFGVIEVRRLGTNLGGRRPEPVTYWTTVGDRAVLGGTDKKFAEMAYGFRGFIPDGLLFRVSSIDPEMTKAFLIQDGFIRSLMLAGAPAMRMRLAGLGSAKVTGAFEKGPQ